MNTPIIRLGSSFTQLHMSEEEQKLALADAYWRTASPHEWVWTQEQQARMALYVLWASQRLECIQQAASAQPLLHQPTQAK